MKSKFHPVCAYWLPGLAMVLLLLTGCAVATSASSQTNGIHIQSEASKLSFDTPALMCRAVLVMDASISGFGPSHWNSQDGTRPASADELTLEEQGYMIYTPAHFSYMHIHMDFRSQSTTEFDTVGGKVGLDTDDEGYPQIMPQQHYLLVFVYGINVQTQDESKSVLIVTDAFPIDAQGIVTLRPGDVEQPGDVHPAITMPLTQIVQQLADCKLS